jgi:hypothetical protein
MRDLFAKVRPQILLAIVVLGLISLYALRLGFTEVVTGSTTGMVALSMKILEDKD